MQGRDFSTLQSILTKESLSFLENKGEKSFIEHDRLSKMYFESIWVWIK